MKRWSWLLLAALAAAPAIADDKKKDDKKAKDAPVAQAPAAPDAVKDAEAKLAAGDADGAVAALEKAMGGDPKAALRLGQIRESRGELDLAVDAYKSAADRLTGAAKGEALARMAVVQDTRGMSDAAANAEAALAADPEGLWPTIAMAYRRVHEGKADDAIALAQKAVAAGGGAAATAATAHAQEAKGNLAAAEASYRQAIAADPTALGPIVGLATVLGKTGRAAEVKPGDTIVFRHPSYGMLIKQVEDARHEEGTIFVVAINRNSVDSRRFGPIKRDSVIGKVLWHIARPAG